MLPITRHHTLVIPHRLALIAAAVCMALAFTADRGKLEGPLQAESGKPLEQLESVNGGSASAGHGEQPGSSTGSGNNPTLLPWFSGLMHR